MRRTKEPDAHTRGGGGGGGGRGECWAAVIANRDFKNADFVGIISNVLIYIPLSPNQLLKSAYDSCIETLQSKIKKLRYM
jgi:hypothetical protein